MGGSSSPSRRHDDHDRYERDRYDGRRDDRLASPHRRDPYEDTRRDDYDVDERYEHGRRHNDEPLEAGMRVEARFRGRERFYPGRIIRARLNGYDIEYDDGEEERGVDRNLIRTLRQTREGLPP